MQVLRYAKLNRTFYSSKSPLYAFSTSSTEGPATLLEKRNALNQITSPVLKDSNFNAYCAKELNIKGTPSAYAGFDPTADSLHLGNFFSIISLLRLGEIGIKPILLVGGATGLIGDPSGKSKEREFMTSEMTAGNGAMVEATLKNTVTNIHSYLKKNATELQLSSEFLTEYEIVNNRDFYEKISAIDFVRDIGKHFRMGVLLAKDSVSARMTTTEGMSFTEFTYQLFQAHDFGHLYRDKNCAIQIGGSDQWGNITSGTDYIRKTIKSEAFGMTTPLLLTAAGQKFGKSEGNAIWIDPRKTPSYDLYQYLFNTVDKDVVSLLKRFTFIPLNRIEEIEKEHQSNPNKRLAQKILAETLIEMIGGKTDQDPAKANDIFFKTDIQELAEKSAEELQKLLEGIKTTKFNAAASEGDSINLLDLLSSLKLKSSKSELRRYASSGAILVNGAKVSLQETMEVNYKNKALWMAQKYLIIRFGKKEFYLIEYTN